MKALSYQINYCVWEIIILKFLRNQSVKMI